MIPLLKLGELFTFNSFLKKFSVSDKVFGQQANCCKIKWIAPRKIMGI